jgi:aminoglycoside phosphotransferase (APT) family kinase protein
MRSASAKKDSAKQIDKFRRHARFVVKHHFGNGPARMTYRSGGLSNFVFEVKHGEGDFIIRISPDQSRLNAFIKEHWCERVARQAGVPTAEILETGFSVIPFPYVIARSVKGTDATLHPERQKIVRELGSLGAKINSIRTHGFGETFDWSNNELSRNRTLKDYLDDEYRFDASIEDLGRSKLCSQATMKSLKRICRELRTLNAKPRLSHGDLRLKNVIVDDGGKIVAVIDWEKATSNIAPHWELSLALHDLDIDMQQELVDGYGLNGKKLAEIAPFVKAFNLLNYADAINRATEAKDKRELERLRNRLSGSFDLYSL